MQAIRAIDDVLDGAERAGKGSRRADPGKEFKHAGVNSSFLVYVLVVCFYVHPLFQWSCSGGWVATLLIIVSEPDVLVRICPSQCQQSLTAG